MIRLNKDEGMYEHMTVNRNYLIMHKFTNHELHIFTIEDKIHSIYLSIIILLSYYTKTNIFALFDVSIFEYNIHNK